MRRTTTSARLLTATLLAASMALYGQTDGQSGEETAQRLPPSEAPVPASPAQTTAETGSRRVAPTAETGAAGSAAGSPFEYEPSEDISEDLSVSFPVDI